MVGVDLGEVRAMWMGGPRHGRSETVVPSQPVYVDDSAERILGYDPRTRWSGGTVWLLRPKMLKEGRRAFNFWVLEWDSRRRV